MSLLFFKKVDKAIFVCYYIYGWRRDNMELKIYECKVCELQLEPVWFEEKECK